MLIPPRSSTRKQLLSDEVLRRLLIALCSLALIGLVGGGVLFALRGILWPAQVDQTYASRGTCHHTNLSIGSWPVGNRPTDVVSCEAVVTTQDPEIADILALRDLIPLACRLLIFDKPTNASAGTGGACALLAALGQPANTNCTSIRNFGREFDTYLTYVAQRYDSLPDWLILVPGAIHRHDRDYHLSRMMNKTLLSGEPRQPDAFWCVRRMLACEGFFPKPLQNVSQYHHFGMESYNSMHPGKMSYARTGDLIRDGIGAVRGHALSRLSPLEAEQGWAQQASSTWASAINRSSAGANATLVQGAKREECRRACVSGVCHYGLLTTTREQIRAQPLLVYENLLREFNHTNPEAGFVLEVIAELVFGRLVSAGRRLPPFDDESCSHDCSLACPNNVASNGRHADCADDPQGADPSGPAQPWMWHTDHMNVSSQQPRWTNAHFYDLLTVAALKQPL